MIHPRRLQASDRKSWLGLHGHDGVVERFRTALSQGRLGSAFLFVGPEGIGKRRFALQLAQSLLCRTVPATELNPCGTCPGCRQAIAQTHPDLILVAKPPDKNVLPISLLIGSKENRMREGLCYEITHKPFLGDRKIAILDDADALNLEAANSLLKTLEEPPPGSMLILIGTSEDRQLPTIRSRSQIIRFRPLSDELVANLLMEHGDATSRDEAERWASHSEGSLSRAKELQSEEVWRFRETLLKHFSQASADSVGFASEAAAFVDAAGKEAPLRRARMRQMFRFAADFYRQILRTRSGAEYPADGSLASAVERVDQQWTIDLERFAALAVERCLEALMHVDRNVQQQALLECWLDDLAQLAAGRSLGI
ncbi:MAG: DNA polymerase III subunit delta' [Planctomycetales bacterium]